MNDVPVSVLQRRWKISVSTRRLLGFASVLVALAPVWFLPARQLPSLGAAPSERLSTLWGLFGWLETVTHRDGEAVCDIFVHDSGVVLTVAATCVVVVVFGLCVLLGQKMLSRSAVA